MGRSPCSGDDPRHNLGAGRRARRAEHGALSISMSKVAEAVGIGRAMLYRYFPSIEAILHAYAWHQRQIADHVHQLVELCALPSSPADQLRVVLARYAELLHHFASHHPTGAVGSLLHRTACLHEAEDQVGALLAEMLVAAASSDAVRVDVAPDELAMLCLHSLAAARQEAEEDAPAAARRRRPGWDRAPARPECRYRAGCGRKRGRIVTRRVVRGCSCSTARPHVASPRSSAPAIDRRSHGCLERRWRRVMLDRSGAAARGSDAER